MSERAEYLDNEWFVVRHSGELPEVALHSSLYFLTEADDGPKLSLTGDQCRELQEAAVERYREIILRDLQPENRGTTMYRGVQRSIINYQRYQQFCNRQGLDMPSCFVGEVAASLLLFLVTEAVDVGKGIRQSVINCTFLELNRFAVEIGLVPEMLPDGLAFLCQAKS